MHSSPTTTEGHSRIRFGRRKCVSVARAAAAGGFRGALSARRSPLSVAIARSVSRRQTLIRPRIALLESDGTFAH
ncbi:hypothetical protein EVAR_97441_1 [Eumeta japonica]|uniref:Uncharacterized protein n=1 Tax=Eumeta variegata TaxID=151549 RepID=A0A4C1WYU2_EUMVA|nr:hypothetical protein EVAR_97441_1 [Eumeta japonica]